MTTAIAPLGASTVERDLDATSAARVAALPATLPQTAWDAARIPDTWLPVLAWALSVDLWDPDWEPARQREAIRDAYAQHRLKGTPAGWKLVLDRVGAVYEIVERPGGAPFRANIDINNINSITLPSEASLLALLERTKRATVHLRVTASAGAAARLVVAMGAGAAAVGGGSARLTIDETA